MVPQQAAHGLPAESSMGRPRSTKHAAHITLILFYPCEIVSVGVAPFSLLCYSHFHGRNSPIGCLCSSAILKASLPHSQSPAAARQSLVSNKIVAARLYLSVKVLILLCQLVNVELLHRM